MFFIYVLRYESFGAPIIVIGAFFWSHMILIMIIEFLILGETDISEHWKLNQPRKGYGIEIEYHTKF